MAASCTELRGGECPQRPPAGVFAQPHSPGQRKAKRQCPKSLQRCCKDPKCDRCRSWKEGSVSLTRPREMQRSWEAGRVKSGSGPRRKSRESGFSEQRGAGRCAGQAGSQQRVPESRTKFPTPIRRRARPFPLKAPAGCALAVELAFAQLGAQEGEAVLCACPEARFPLPPACRPLPAIPFLRFEAARGPTSPACPVSLLGHPARHSAHAQRYPRPDVLPPHPSPAAPRRPLAHSPAPERLALPARLPFRPAAAEPGRRSLGSPAEAGGGRRGGGDPRRVPASPRLPRPRLGLESPPVAQPVGGEERSAVRKGGRRDPLERGREGRGGGAGGESSTVRHPPSHFPAPESPFYLRKGQECL